MNYAEYFEHRYGKADPANWVCLASLHNARGAKKTDKGKFLPTFFKADNAEGMAQFAAEHGGVHNVYASANTFSKEARGKEFLAQILRLHVDIDHVGTWSEGKPKVDEISARIGDFTQKVDTGGGVQIEWDLPEPLPATTENVALVDDYQQQLVEKYGGDSGARALNHVLRVPGTKNFPDYKKAVTKERGWDPLDVSEPSLQDRTFTPEWLGLKSANGAALSLVTTKQPGGDPPRESEGITRDSCNLDLPDKVWGVIEDGGEDLSKALWYVLHMSVKYGASDALIHGIVLHPHHAVGEHRRRDPGDMKTKGRAWQLQKEIDKVRAQVAAEAAEAGGDFEPTYSDGGAFLGPLNEHYFVTRRSGKTVVVERDFDEALDRRLYVFQSFQSFRDYYATVYVNVGVENPKPKSIGGLWLKSPRRRSFSKMIFDPARDPGDCGDAWNMWEGWQIEPKPGDWTKFGEHLRRNICANDQALETMVTDLLSYWFQHPERQGEVALAMRGDQGTGKGIFANAILKLWGAHGLYIAHGGHLTGNFNNHLMNCCCLFADEAVFAGDHKAVNILKSLVTEPFIAIESKGVDVAPAINRLKIILATNEPRVIRAGREERRYQILEVGDDMKQNAAYFGAIVAELKAGGYAALLHDLLARDIGDRPPTVITTAGLMNQQTQSLEPIQAWWLGCLEVGEFLGCYYWPEKGMREQVGWFDHPTGTELHEGFKDWCKSENVRPPAGSAQTFSTQINKMLDGNRPKRLHGNRKEFPPLEQCREWFLLYQNWPDRDWEETPDEMC